MSVHCFVKLTYNLVVVVFFFSYLRTKIVFFNKAPDKAFNLLNTTERQEWVSVKSLFAR